MKARDRILQLEIVEPLLCEIEISPAEWPEWIVDSDATRGELLE
jgi:hypothetical protein